jgi:hypothetical protein
VEDSIISLPDFNESLEVKYKLFILGLKSRISMKLSKVKKSILAYGNLFLMHLSRCVVRIISPIELNLIMSIEIFFVFSILKFVLLFINS